MSKEYFFLQTEGPKDEVHKSKISSLKMSLINGNVFTPVLAGKMFSIQHNTFHRLIWQLRHDGMEIKAEKVPGKTWKRYWVEK